jgi:arylsulfatase A-like enzyme
MNKYLFLAILFLAAGINSCRSDSTEKPNIVFIMADDLGYGDLGCYGATKIRTPNIDKLAENGIKLMDAHSPASVCTPTRYGVLTGRYSWRGRLKSEVHWSGYERCLVEQGRKTIGNMMQESGYKTAQIGKWHLGWEDEEPVNYDKGYLGRGPADLGFNYSFVTACAHNLSPITFVENHKIMSKLVPLNHQLYYPFNGGPMKENQIAWHETHDLGPLMIADDWQADEVDSIYTRKTIEFITAHCTDSQSDPFYIHLTPEAPHRPNIVPDFMKQKSEAGIRGDHIQMLDWMVGQIMSTIEELGIQENTLLILTSDNGPREVGFDGFKDGKIFTNLGHKSAGDLHGFKSSIWEGGHRVPFIACWPGKIDPGSVGDQLICLTDMMATFAGVVGYDLGEDMGEDSFNALPVLLGEQNEIRESIINQDFSGNLAMRKGPWKLIDNRLYNLEDDPGETTDFAQDKPEIAEKLRALLQKQVEEGRTANPDNASKTP